MWLPVESPSPEGSLIQRYDAIQFKDAVLVPNQEPLPTLPVIANKKIGGNGQTLRFYNSRAALPDWDISSPVWPIKINQYFSARHTGTDLDCDRREPIYSVEAGVVVWAGWNGGYGKEVKIQHAGGFQTLYGHNDQIFVKVGETIARHQIIASCGTTGHSTGYHSHFEIIFEDQWINPLTYILKAR